MISTEALNQFKTIMLEDYGVNLDDNDAIGLAEDYLVALETVLKQPGIASLEYQHLTRPVEREQNDD